MAFDPVNRLTHTTDPLGGITYVGYDLANNRVLSLDQVGRPSYFVWDELNRLYCRYNALLETTYTHYDARSAATKQIDGEGRTAYYTFDRLGRQTHQKNALDEVTYFGYSGRGNRVVVVNPRGNATYFRFDLLSRLSEREHQLGGVRYFGYDPSSNQVLQLDERLNPTYFTLDGLNRVTHSKDALLAVSYMGYDERSSPVLRLDADGRASYMAYDGARRLERTWYANPVETADQPIYYGYDQVSNLASVDDSLAGLGVSTNEFDKLDRLTKKNTVAGAVYYAYDLSGRKTSLKDPSLEENVYVHDDAGRLQKVELSGARTAYYQYDKAGMLLKRIQPNNDVIAYHTYDVAARLASLKLWSSGAEIQSSVYTRNANGEITRVEQLSGGWQYYAYDELERLTYEGQQFGALLLRHNDYTYDETSNRTKKADEANSVRTYYEYDTRNLLTKEFVYSSGPTTYYDYDQSQRMSAARTTDSGGQSSYFAYNQRAQVTGLDFTRSGGGADPTQALHYTGVGERVVVAGGGTPSYWAFDGNKLLREAAADGSVTAYYRHNQSPWDGLGSLIEVVSDFGEPATRETAHAGFDQRGSVTKLVTSTGDTANSYSYDAFGVGGGAPDEQRLKFVSPVLISLNLDAGFYLAPNGLLYLPSNGQWATKSLLSHVGLGAGLSGLAGLAGMLGANAGGLEGQDAPIPRQEDEDQWLTDLLGEGAGLLGEGLGAVNKGIEQGAGWLFDLAREALSGSSQPDTRPKCGPDVTQGFSNAMDRITRRLHAKYYSLNPIDIVQIRSVGLFDWILTDYVGFPPDWLAIKFMAANGFEMDYWPSPSRNCPDIMDRCPTSDGSNFTTGTVTICGLCTEVARLGDFIYGFVGGWLGLSQFTLRAGGLGAELAANHAFGEPPQSTEMYKAASAFGGGQPPRVGQTQMCPHFRGGIVRRLPCRLCPEVSPGRVRDFSTAKWQYWTHPLDPLLGR